jgi:hypothetical protein
VIVRCCKCMTLVDLSETCTWEGDALCDECVPRATPKRIACCKCLRIVPMADTHEHEGDALCSDCYTDGPACSECNGSGEGQADGTTCSRCKGRGQLPSPQDIEQTEDREEARAERWEEERCKQH